MDNTKVAEVIVVEKCNNVHMCMKV